jgi:hypothetical protein
MSDSYKTAKNNIFIVSATSHEGLNRDSSTLSDVTGSSVRLHSKYQAADLRAHFSSAPSRVKARVCASRMKRPLITARTCRVLGVNFANVDLDCALNTL